MSRRAHLRVAAIALVSLALTGAAAAMPAASAQPRPYQPVVWRDSVALGQPTDGALVRGTVLPAKGLRFFTWDPERHRSPSPIWRRYATDRLIRVLLRVSIEFARAHPGAARLGIGDLSRPRGGRWPAQRGPRLLHASHQNGLDADVYYPRRDRRELRASRVGQIDRRLAQELVDRFVRAGAQAVFVGPRTGLTGPRGVVTPLRLHDDHLHVRIARR